MNRITLGMVALLAGTVAAPAMAQTQVNAPDTGPFDGVFVEQIGNNNSGSFSQSAAEQNAEVTQDGDDNTVLVAQFGDGDHFAGIDQTGNDNIASVTQGGSAQNVALLAQTGDANTILLAQNDSGLAGSGAAITQNGSGNLATLIQDGDDNQAILAQNGDNNTMSATQIGAGNALEWTQNGNGLPDMAVIQSGGATAIITQGN